MTGSELLVQIKEKDLAQHMKIVQQPEEGKKYPVADWSLGKNGQSGIYYPIAFEGEYYNEIPLTFQLKNPSEVRQISIGFMISENYENKKLFLTPSYLIIEGGMNKECLQSLGELRIINDESYTNYRIKVYVKNFLTLGPQQGGQSCCRPLGFDQVFQQFTVAVKQIQFIRLRIGRPIVSVVDGQNQLSKKIDKKGLGS